MNLPDVSLRARYKCIQFFKIDRSLKVRNIAKLTVAHKNTNKQYAQIEYAHVCSLTALRPFLVFSIPKKCTYK